MIATEDLCDRKTGKHPVPPLKNIAVPGSFLPSSASRCFNRFFFSPPSCSVLEVINLDVEDGKLGTSSLKTLRAGQVSLNERAFTGFSVFSAAAEVTILGQERK